MAGGVQNMDQFELYFKRADLDQDGKISGPEAVSFFQASGLPKPVLAQIWTHADQNRTGYLGRTEFYNYLKLVTVAQSKQELTPDIVKAALYGPASAKIPVPHINLGALPAPKSNLNVGSPSPQMGGSATAASHSMVVRGPQGYSSQQTQVIRPPRPPLNNTTLQSQHGVSHGMPSGGTMLTSRPPSSNISNDWLGERTGGPSAGVSSQIPFSGINPSTPLDVFGLASSGSMLSAQPRPQVPTSLSQNVAPISNGPNLAASGAGAKDSSSPVAGNGFASSSVFGDAFSAASSQGKHNSVFPVSTAASLPVSSSNIPASAGTQVPNKPSHSFQSNVAQQSTVGHNQQMQSTFKHSQQVPVQNSSTFPVRAENVPSSQSSQPWPKMSQSNIQKYTKVFMEVDTDRDGKITGEQARTLFLSWRLPREILKQVWDLSDQDNDSMLSLKEFCIALYLMERYREGHPLPRVLPASVIFEGTTLPPSGPAPAAYGAPAWRPPSGVQQAHGMTGPRQVTPVAARPPRPVPVPIPEVDEDVQPRQHKHRVPVLEKHLVDQLSIEEKNSLNSKFQEATEADKKVGELEKEISEAKQKIEFYRSKMQEIVLYKSRCDNRLNEVTERVSVDKREVESLSKRYEDKYKQTGDVASKLTIEEATFRDIQDEKMELYRAIVKLEQDGKPDDIQAHVDRIQADLEEQVKALNEHCKMYGLRGKPTTLVELPFGWQPGIQGAADWDEHWDKFEDEGFTFVKELTLDEQNVIAPPKPKSAPVQNKSIFQDEGAITLSSSDANDKSEKLPVVEEKTSDDESNEQKKDSSVKPPTDSADSRKAAESPSKIFQDSAEKNTGEDSSPHAIKTHSEHSGAESVFSGEKTFDEPGWGTFDNHYDSDATWDLNATKPKDMDQESKHESSFFDSDGWGDLNPIRTEVPKKSTYTFDSVPGTPAYNYAGSPSGDKLFQNQGPFASAFADSVPSTPAYSYAGSPHGNIQPPFASAFADSVPSTPMFSSNSPRRYSDGPDDISFTNNFSRFDSFSSSTPRDGGLFPPRDSFSRFDSFRSTAQDSEYDQGFYPPQTIARFDSMRSSTADSEFGHSLFQPRESFSRFDSMRSTNDSSDFNHGFPSFDDADPFGSSDPLRSHEPFKTAVESETPRRDSVDSWKAF